MLPQQNEVQEHFRKVKEKGSCYRLYFSQITARIKDDQYVRGQDLESFILVCQTYIIYSITRK